MSLSAPTIDSRPTLVASATVKNLVADVSRVADQNQMVAQNSNAFSGARSVNDMTDTAVISQTAAGINNKKIEIQNPAAETTAILAADFDSLVRATIEQNQGTFQGTFAQGTDFDGNPSSAVNNAALSEDVTQDQASKIRTELRTLKSGETAQAPAPQPPSTSALQHSTLDTAATTEPSLPTSKVSTPPTAHTSTPPTVDSSPARDFRMLHHPLSVHEEQNRLASSASLSLPSFLGYQFNLANLSIPSFITQTSDALHLPSTPVIESRNVFAPLPAFIPGHFTQRPLAFHPDVFTLPAPVRLNLMG